ncbi:MULTISPECIES: Acg family FMN-binding oxidoreductase [Burkholderia]|uniref:Nitroreductase n=1 Tax=Burkholderia mayonis TaxID=1385591 RepID=A0A1B4FPH7_9BURK|nr:MULTISPECIES: nitroreductase family protein [Burkholderia]AOJ05577.1 nitroreductase [Burkholderia mayonis]KVE34710.1 nitroreductase [Burkholderia sp. BDU5]KVE45648.1 nitroreductase [Burkholderia mayonis]
METPKLQTPPHDDIPPFDPSASVEDQLRLAIRYAILAPSSHNTQPWRFILGDASVMLCADRLRALPVVDPYDRELLVSCGAALFNLRVALSHFGFAYSIDMFPSSSDPDVIALVRLDPRGYHDESLVPLFDAIVERVTTRAPFADEAVSCEIQRALVDAGAAEGAEIACVDAPAAREEIAELIAEADHLQFADLRFRRELANWVHPRRRDDGMPAFAAGVPALLDFATPVVASVIRTFDLGGGMAAMHHKLVDGSPLVVGISTASDDRDAWVATGQALERVLLVATAAGLTASYLNQPIEIDMLRERLRPLLHVDAHPQLLLRIGRGPVVPHAPRRPLMDVVS